MVVNVSIDERDSLVIFGMLDQNKNPSEQNLKAFVYP